MRLATGAAAVVGGLLLLMFVRMVVQESGDPLPEPVLPQVQPPPPSSERPVPTRQLSLPRTAPAAAVVEPPAGAMQDAVTVYFGDAAKTMAGVYGAAFNRDIVTISATCYAQGHSPQVCRFTDNKTQARSADVVLWTDTFIRSISVHRQGQYSAIIRREPRADTFLRPTSLGSRIDLEQSYRFEANVFRVCRRGIKQPK